MSNDRVPEIENDQNDLDQNDRYKELLEWVLLDDHFAAVVDVESVGGTGDAAAVEVVVFAVILLAADDRGNAREEAPSKDVWIIC